MKLATNVLIVLLLVALHPLYAARYVRVEFYDSPDSSGSGSVILGEIEVLASGNNLASRRTATTSGAENVARLTDGVTPEDYDEFASDFWDFSESDSGGNFSDMHGTLSRLVRFDSFFDEGGMEYSAPVLPSPSAPHWIEIDLGRDVSIDSIRVHLDPYRRYSFAVFQADAPGEWLQLETFQNNRGTVTVAVDQPKVVVKSATMRPGTSLMDVVFRVNDQDSPTVKVRALAFEGGERSFAKVIKPVTFVDGPSLPDDSVPTNVDHTVTWDVGADWPVDLGFAKFEVLAQDDRGLLAFEWITVPATGETPALTISKNPPSNSQVFDALCWLYASGHPGLVVQGEVLKSTDSFIYQSPGLVSGSSVLDYAAPYLFETMNLALATAPEIDLARTARAPIAAGSGWFAKNQPRELFDTYVVGWGGPTAPTPWSLNGVVAIAAGAYHGLALRTDGTVSEWGSNATPPNGLAAVVAVAAGRYFSLALKSDGTVVGWGLDNGSGQATPPEGLGGVTAIAAGGSHSLALKSDGTVVGWGADWNGQRTPPEGLGGVTAIAAGGSHSLALKTDGTVVEWGNGFGQPAPNYGQTAPPEGLSGVVAIAAGAYHSLALRTDGTVVGWGSNDYGQAAPPGGLSEVVAIAAGAYHSLALKSDGTVVGWGNGFGQPAPNYGQTAPPEGLSGVVGIAAGGSHSLAIVREND